MLGPEFMNMYGNNHRKYATLGTIFVECKIIDAAHGNKIF